MSKSLPKRGKFSAIIPLNKFFSPSHLWMPNYSSICSPDWVPRIIKNFFTLFHSFFPSFVISKFLSLSFILLSICSILLQMFSVALSHSLVSSVPIFVFRISLAKSSFCSCIFPSKYHWTILSFIAAYSVSLQSNQSSPSFSMGDKFQDAQWMPEAADSTKLYTHYVFFLHIHTYNKV